MTEMKACHRHDTFYWIVCEACLFGRMAATLRAVLKIERARK